MEFVPAGVNLSFEVTFDRDDLFVGMSVYDTSGSIPSLVSGPTLMNLLAGYTYFGKFTPNPNASYVIIKAVYTDGTLTVLDGNYSQGSESIFAQFTNTFPPPSEIQGVIASPVVLVGVVETDDALVGVIEC